MADTVNLNNITEYFDEADKLKTKIAELVKLIQNAKHCIVFTGAGISTSAKIPDFRGPNGVWTRQAEGKEAPGGVSLEQALPTFCHMAIAELVAKGVVKYVVSQNIDGLHRRSGIPADKISELHGNCYLETCWDCNAEHLRTFDVSEGGGIGGPGCPICLKRVPYFCHCTGRKCKCGKQLKDSIIHFKENLPVEALRVAMNHGREADLCIALGSSLTVSPACLIPQESLDNGGKVVVINLQKTGYDKKSAVRLFAKTDGVMEEVMSALKISVPAFEKSKAFADEQARKKEQGDVSRPTADPGADDSQFILGNKGKKNKKKNAKSEPDAELDDGKKGNAKADKKAKDADQSLMDKARSLLASLNLPGGSSSADKSDAKNADKNKSDGKNKKGGVLYDKAEAEFLNSFPSPTVSASTSNEDAAASGGFTLDAAKDKGGYVNPKTDCPHVAAMELEALTLKDAARLVASPCQDCQDPRENWYCEHCRFVGCSRYVQGHMASHNSTARHTIATSLRDLNTWCYECETYIQSPKLLSSRAAVYFAKFGTLPADMLKALPPSVVSAAAAEMKDDAVSASATPASAASSSSASSSSSSSSAASSLSSPASPSLTDSAKGKKGQAKSDNSNGKKKRNHKKKSQPATTSPPPSSTSDGGADDDGDDDDNASAVVADVVAQDKGGYVNPITTCPHVAALRATPLTMAAAAALVNGPCTDCNDERENWYCEHCRFIGCSRYVQGHMAHHNTINGEHVIATSLRDLNTWCYECEAYVVSPNLYSTRAAVYFAKFGCLPPV